jgi:hypothetical protein
MLLHANVNIARDGREFKMYCSFFATFFSKLWTNSSFFSSQREDLRGYPPGGLFLCSFPLLRKRILNLVNPACITKPPPRETGEGKRGPSGANQDRTSNPPHEKGDV